MTSAWTSSWEGRGFGDSFAVEIELRTNAFTFGGGEIDVDADFFSTGNVALGTSTPGVSFQVLVPEPALGLLLGVGLRGLQLGRRRAVVSRD
jgi:hypothetical protein